MLAEASLLPTDGPFSLEGIRGLKKGKKRGVKMSQTPKKDPSVETICATTGIKKRGEMH